MTTPEHATESQALALLYALAEKADVETIMNAVVLDRTSNKIDMPEAIQVRNGIEPTEAKDYSAIAYCLKPDPTQEGTLATVNLLWRNIDDRLYPRHNISYRVIGSAAASVTLEKHLIGEPRAFSELDRAQASENVLERLEEDGVDLSDKLLTPDEYLRGLALSAQYYGEHFAERLNGITSAQQNARQLGLTTVYADEAIALINLYR